MAIYRLEGEVSSECKLIHAKETSLEYESDIEDWLENSPWALIQDETIIWIDRQPSAKDEEGTIYPDLVGVDIDGNLVIVEFKRERAPRDVVAQILEYAAWADGLSDEEIHKIAENYFDKNDMYQGKGLTDVFSEIYDLPENDELPLLNRKLRLYIVAGEIPERITGVCKYLRNTQGIDISCIVFSIFQTEAGEVEAGEVLVNTEVKVGGEPIVKDKSYQSNKVTPLRWSGDKPVKQIVKEAVLEITNKDKTYEFQLKEVRSLILSKYPDFNESTADCQLYADCVNHPSRHHYPGGEDFYWRVSRGRYRLYDEKTDTINNNLENL